MTRIGAGKLNLSTSISRCVWAAAIWTKKRERAKPPHFCCFITPSRATLRPLKRLFRAVDTRPAVGKLADALDAVLRAHLQISDIEWQDEQAA